MKKLVFLTFLIPMFCNAQFDELLKLGKEKLNTILKTESGVDIAAGLKEALNKGVSDQVSKLTAPDGFYKNEAVKILMPDELKKIDQTLRKLGLNSLADDGIKALNRAAEDAVKESTPIFVSAITNINFADAKTILMGEENAATAYLQNATTKELYKKCNPIVKKSIGKVGADVIWTSIIKKYNAIPFVNKVNPDITDYVTHKALDGVFKMITVEEKELRSNFSSRSSQLLQKVFALQDKF
jgi:hypothetical protein